MDVTGIFNAGGVLVKNPNYSKSKKNTQPEYITVTDFSQLPSGSTTGTALTDVAYQGAEKNGVILGDYDDWKKYINHGITPNSIEQNLDIQLANNQSFLEKATNSILQTIGSELVLGSIKGFSDILDLAGQITGITDGDYTNPVSKFLEEKQEEFKEWAPVFVDPNKHLSNGGLLDSGWWFSNMPSIVSSISLMLPGFAATRLGSAIGKATKLTSFTRNAVRTLSGAEKAIKAGNNLNTFQRVLNSEATAKKVGLFLENGTTAVLSRAAENYQEARQTYSDTYQDIRSTIHEMDDKQYAKFIKDNEQLLNDKKADLNNKDNVAKAIASAAADRTFQMDWANVIFDVVQMYTLRNAWKGFKNANENPIKIKRANKDAAKYLGKSKEEIAKIKAARPTYKKAGEWAMDNLYGSTAVVASELSEGIEEAVNYIAQQEGTHFGKVLLNKESGSKDTGWAASMSKFFDPRMKQYVQAPELWDSAFWGVMGGVVFQKLGSQFNRIKQKLTEDKSEANEKSKESLPWYKLDDLPETKRRLSEIEARGLDFKTYQENLAKIKSGVDIYNSTEDNEIKFDTKEEQEAAATKLKNEYIAKMTLRAMNNGNLNMLKAYINDDNFREAIVEQGLFNDDKNNKPKEQLLQEARQYTDDALNIIDKVEKAYDEELVAINAAAANMSRKGIKDMPIEYMQIMAVNNVKSRLEKENIDTELAPINKRIAEIKKQFEDSLDKNLDYDHAVKVGILTEQLGTLYATKRQLLKDESKSLTNQIAIKRINKNIDNIEKQLNDEELVYANFIGLQYKFDEKGKAIQSKEDEDLQLAFAYRDAQIVDKLNDGKTSKSINIPGLEFLSERSRKTINENAIGKYKTFESDTKTIWNDLKEISPELNTYLQLKTLLELRKDNINSEITRTVKQVEEEANSLHNTMNEARRDAINQANDTIQKLYKKHKDVIKEAIYNRVNNISSKHETLSDEENNALNNALEILDLTKSYNSNLVDLLEAKFDLQDAIEASQEVQDDENTTSNEEKEETKPESKSESEPETRVNSTIIQNPSTEPQQQQPINQSPQPQEMPISQKNDQLSNNKIKQDLPQNGRMMLNTTITIDKDGKATLGDKNGKNIITQLDDDNNNIIVINDDESLLTDTFFDNIGDVNLTRPLKVESNPYIDKDTNSIHKGHLINTDTIDSQQDQDNNQNNNNGSTETPQVSSTGEQTANKTQGTQAQGTQGTQDTQAKNTSLPKTKNVDPVPDLTPDSSTIEIEAIGACQTAFRNNHNINLDDYAKELINNYVAKGLDRTIVEKAVNNAVDINKRTIERIRKKLASTMNSAIDEYVLQSAITELSNNNNPFTNDFIKAAENLINQYCKEKGITLLNNKKYINLEDMLRYINETTSDTNIASFIYSTIKEYLKTDKAKEEFITMDETEIDNNDFLNKALESAEERYKKLSEKNSVHRVDIRRFAETLTKQERNEFYQALDELKKDDELKVKQIDDKLYLYDNKNRVVGRLPIPTIDASTGAYIVYNDGWKYDITENYSNLKNLFIKWIKGTNEASKELNNIIYELAFEKVSKERKLELLDKFSKNNEIINAKKEYTHSLASDETLLNGLVKLWKFIRLPNSKNKNNDLLNLSINLWFNKLYHSYDAVTYLTRNGKVKITVDDISEGELIKVQDKVKNSDELPIASKAIAGGLNTKVTKIGIGGLQKIGYVTVSGHSPVEFNGVGKANTFVMLSDKSKRPAFVQAFPVKTSDKEISKDAKELITAIKNEIAKLLNNYANNDTNKEENYEALKNFLIKAFSYKNNSTLFNGVVVTINPRGINESISISIPGTSTVFQFYKYTNNSNTTHSSLVRLKQNDGKWINESFNSEKTIKYINDLIDKLTFKFDYAYILSDNSDITIKGIATRNNGKFEINVGDFHKSYDSFNDFILKNNLVRLNTKPSKDGKTNFKRVSDNQVANQVLEIKIEKDTSSPVEETKQVKSSKPIQVTKSIEDQLIDILKSYDKNINKAEAIIRLVYKDNNILSTFKTLHLLPENLIFDEKFNDIEGNEDINAQINIKTNIVTVGKKWVDLFKNPNTRAQAIRKLIHEQLHSKLSNNRGYVRSAQAIYQEFKDNLDKGIENEWYKKWREENNISKEDADKYFRQYLNEDLDDNVAFEEFLVESLTSKDLAQMLNNIETNETTGSKRKNMFQKILEFLSKVFDWGVVKGSLYEKELNTLRNILNKDKTTKNNVENNDSQSNNVEDNNQILENNADENNQEETKSKNKIEDDNNQIKEFGKNNSRRFRGKFRSRITELSNNTNTYNEEEQNIISEAKQNGTFMKALNGKKSNLTERQWIQVRTKAFKDWFGDWEQIAYDNARLNSIPNLRKINVDSFLKKVDDRLEKDWITTGYLNRESVEVIKKLFDLSKTQLYQGDIKEKGLSFYTGAIVLNTMPIEEAAKVFVHEILHSYTTYAYDTDATFRKEIDKYHKIALNHDSGFSKDVYEFMANTLEPYHMATLLEIPSENNGSNLLKDIINSLVRYIRNFFRAYETNKKRTLFHDIIETIYNHKRNNSESINDVSKVVDENGEPLVVYHGSDFENDATKKGDWSKNALPYATYFSVKPYAENTLPYYYSAFLNIRNPKYDHYNLTEDAIQSEDVFNKFIIKEGFDGAITGNENINRAIDAKEIVVTNPNQIKSATDNNGNFSKDDNNIYHSRITEIKRTPNMFDFIDSLPTSVRAKTAQMLYSADLKMSCR